MKKRTLVEILHRLKKIENYPGLTDISGPKLMDRMAEQAETNGAKIETGVDVKNIKKTDEGFIIDTNLGDYYAKSVAQVTAATGEGEVASYGVKDYLK